MNILSRSITRGSFTRTTSLVIFILMITGLAKVSSADRTIDGREELVKSSHLKLRLSISMNNKSRRKLFIRFHFNDNKDHFNRIRNCTPAEWLIIWEEYWCIISSVSFFQLLSAIQSIDEVLNPSPTEDESFPRSRRGTPRRWGDTAPWRRASKRMPQQLQKSEGCSYFTIGYAFFTFMYNRSSKMNYFIYISHRYAYYC